MSFKKKEKQKSGEGEKREFWQELEREMLEEELALEAEMEEADLAKEPEEGSLAVIEGLLDERIVRAVK